MTHCTCGHLSHQYPGACLMDCRCQAPDLCDCPTVLAHRTRTEKAAGR